MARKADLLFLKLAVKNRVLDENQARMVLDLLDRKGEGTKARYICVERGLIDEKTAKGLKKLVREYLEQQAENATTGKRIGNYAVESKLGAGAMGMVYRARHVKLGRPVALKLLLPEFAQDEKYIERFEREARAAAQLNHPNIVSCFDAGSENDVVYIAMEFIDGDTVKDLVEKTGTFDEKRAIEVTIQVAKALEHASAAGLMHRDVKPANVMITTEGMTKLLDLGLAKKIEREDDSNLTEAGHAVGTPYYMAPEQALEGTIDHRADLYALGASLYFMLIGEPPYKAPTPTGVLAKHVNDPIPSVRAKRPDLSPGVDKVVTRMLAKKPEDRYQKHATLIADLQDLTSGLMPELKAEKSISKPTRSAKARIAPSRAERSNTGSGSRTPAAKKNATFALAAGLVACGALGTLFALKTTNAAPAEPPRVASSKKTPQGANELFPSDPRLKEGGPAIDSAPVSERETAARRQLDCALTSGKKGWDLENLLESVGRSHTGTKAGEDALAQATQLANKLDADDRAELDRAAKDLEAKAKEGDLFAAAAAYNALADRFHGEGAVRTAHERADAYEKRAQELLASADESARHQEESGRPDLAAKTIRDSLILRKGEARKEAEAKAARLDQAWASRQEDQKEAGLRAELAQASALPAALRAKVRDRKSREGLDVAKALLTKLTVVEARARVQLCQGHMEELAQLDLAAKAFQALKGQAVKIERKGATVVEGTVRSATDKHVSVELRANVQVRVTYEEMDELEVASFLRKGKVLDELKVAHLVAVFKTYRGDDDALSAATNVKDEALAAIARELGPADAGIAVAPKPEELPPGHAAANPNVGNGGASGQAADVQGQPSPSNDREKLIYDNRDKLFPGATQTAWAGDVPVAFYDFTLANRDFRGLWHVEQGTAIPTPAGQVERAGVSLRSADGRVGFDVPFAAPLKARIDFVSWGTLAQTSRFSVVLEDAKKKERVESRFGVLKGTGPKHKARTTNEPEDLLTRITTNRVHTLELVFDKGVITSRLDGDDMGQVEAKDLSDVKLALEWETVTIHVLGVELTGMPADSYLAKAIPESKKKN
jgi:serine/threonine-protein kinase